MEALSAALQSHFQTIIVGRVPSTHVSTAKACESSSCGCSVDPAKSKAATPTIEPLPCNDENIPLENVNDGDTELSNETLFLGGLEIPPCENWSETTLLFVGQDQASRPLQNIMLRFLTDPAHAPAAYWTWNPTTETLSTQASSSLSRLLNRRFYLVQKAKMANIFGILVANPSDRSTRTDLRRQQA